MKYNKKWAELLEAIDSTGSINKASKELGITFKTAWSRLERLKNTYPDLHLVNTEIGGASRGGTYLTSQGRRLMHQLKTI